MTVYRFRPIEHRETRKGNCPVCGKRVTRSQTFSQTLNPFNKNADGTLKDIQDILREIRAEGAEWVPDFTHDKCRQETS